MKTTYLLNDPIADGHNPARLKLSQIDAAHVSAFKTEIRYRTLDADEVGYFKPVKALEWWDIECQVWRKNGQGLTRLTYRTTLSREALAEARK